MPADPITNLLAAWNEGDEQARDRLLESVYPQLRAIAGNRRSQGGTPSTLATTEVVHEAYIRLSAQHQHGYRNRSHFFAIVTRLIRRVLLDHRRSRKRQKRGDGLEPATLADAPAPGAGATQAYERLALERALGELAEVDERAAAIVTLRFLAGLSHDETAEVLGCGRATVARGWRFARAFLRLRLRPGTAAPSNG